MIQEKSPTFCNFRADLCWNLINCLSAVRNAGNEDKRRNQYDTQKEQNQQYLSEFHRFRKWQNAAKIQYRKSQRNREKIRQE